MTEMTEQEYLRRLRAGEFGGGGGGCSVSTYTVDPGTGGGSGVIDPVTTEYLHAAIEGARARDDEIARLRAEVARLREALHRVAEICHEIEAGDASGYEALDVIRAALEGGET